MKYFWLLLLMVSLLIPIFVFANAEEAQGEKPQVCSNVAGTDTCASYKIAGERLLDVSYSSYDFDAGTAFLSRFDAQMGGCSVVALRVDGDVYVGRNYDFYCSDAPAIIVRNNAGAIRTVGIVNSPDSMPAWTENYGLSEECLMKLPYLCCDVMSEAGLYATTNIRLYEEALACAQTNPGAPRRCTQTFMQTMLTQYASIDELLAHVDDYDWFDLSKIGFEQSFLIADQNGRSVVIEFGANAWSYTESDFNANFFLNNELYAIEKYPLGEMRSSKELACKPYVRTEEDIFTMMAQGAYSQFYTTTVDPEYALREFPQEAGYDRFNPSTHDEAIEKMKEILNEFASYTWEEKVANKCWETTFTVAANVSELHMNVHFSEHYGLQFEVAFED